jgi:hypothetical protein
MISLEHVPHLRAAPLDHARLALLDVACVAGVDTRRLITKGLNSSRAISAGGALVEDLSCGPTMIWENGPE